MVNFRVIVVSLGRLVTVLKSSEALDNDITYEGIPVVYWVTAEPVILLLCTCLPASLHLGRHLMSAYVSPVMSAMYTSLASLRGTGRSGSQVDGSCGNGIGSIRSVASQEEFIKVSPHQEYHMADVKAVGLKSKSRLSSQIGGTPNRIRVDNDVFVQRIASLLGAGNVVGGDRLDHRDLDGWQKPLHSYRIDFLSAIEIRSWVARVFDVDLAVFDILGGATVASCAMTIAAKVYGSVMSNGRS